MMDSVMKKMGHCGRFQVLHVALVQSCRFVVAWVISLMVFGLYNPGWRCVEESVAIANEFRSSNLSERANTASDLYANDKSPRHDWATIVRSYDDDDNGTVTGPPFDGTCEIIKSCAAIEFNPASSTIVSEFGLVCDKVWIGYLIVTVLNGGMLLGGFAWGRIGERYGRKVSLYVSNVLMTVCSGLAVLSPTWEVYALFTFFIGFGAVGVATTVSPLCMEFLNSKWRARISSVPVWNTSIIGFACIIYLLRDWRYIHLANTLIGFLSCLGVFWTPESLRWLVLHGKTERAEKVMRQVSNFNKKTVPKESFEKLIETQEDMEVKHHTYLDLFRNPEMRSITCKLGFLGVAMLAVYDILGFGIQSLPGNFYTNIIVASLIEFPGTLSVGVMATKIGRRWTGITLMSIGTVSCAVIVTALLTLGGFEIQAILITTMAFINKSVTQALSDLMFTYTAELVPTAVRNLAFGVLFMSGRVAGLLGPYLIPRDFPSMVACFAVLMGIQFTAACIYYSLPETRDRAIGDTIVITKEPKDGVEKC